MQTKFKATGESFLCIGFCGAHQKRGAAAPWRAAPQAQQPQGRALPPALGMRRQACGQRWLRGAEPELRVLLQAQQNAQLSVPLRTENTVTGKVDALFQLLHLASLCCKKARAVTVSERPGIKQLVISSSSVSRQSMF